MVTSSVSVTCPVVTEVPGSGSIDSGHGRERPRHGPDETCRFGQTRRDQGTSAFPSPSLTSATQRGPRALRAPARRAPRPCEGPDRGRESPGAFGGEARHGPLARADHGAGDAARDHARRRPERSCAPRLARIEATCERTHRSDVKDRGAGHGGRRGHVLMAGHFGVARTNCIGDGAVPMGRGLRGALGGIPGVSQRYPSGYPRGYVRAIPGGAPWHYPRGTGLRPLDTVALRSTLR